MCILVLVGASTEEEGLEEGVGKGRRKEAAGGGAGGLSAGVGYSQETLSAILGAAGAGGTKEARKEDMTSARAHYTSPSQRSENLLCDV